ncbi:MAG: class I SAM-dependent methyltransferase [Xenococcaceae cyanobacterium MO_188.B32]|nr:class I SAM-dependent methyltransferase [Xenococcaceae cyanobacterium MO_188.B32]
MKYWKMDISNKDLAVKKTWYSSVAKTYQQIRPKYPQILIDRVVELAKMPDSATILEIGCGPGTATLPFAKLGFNLTSLEPNPDFCQLARENCRQYTKVEIINSSFEEWALAANNFDGILAATSCYF